MTDRTTKVTLVAQVSQYLAGMAAASKATKDTGSAAEKLGQQKAAYTGVGTAIFAMGAVAAAGLALVVKATADFDAKMSQVKTLSHATATEMTSLSNAALTLGQGIGFSATETADAEIELVKAGISVSDIMGGALKGSLELAAAGQISVGDATEIATIAMTQFGLKGSQIPHVADLLAAGADKALGGVSDLGEALKSGGLVASQFGISLDDTVGVLSAFANAGLIGETAGTDLRQMLLKLADPSAQAADDLKKYGIEIYDASGKFVGITALAGELNTKLKDLDPSTRNAALAQIFGSRAIAGANVLYKEGSAGISSWISKVDDTGFAAQQAAGKMDNLQGDLSKLGAAFQSDVIKAGGSANDVLRTLTQAATDVIKAFGGIPAPAQEGIIAVGALVAVMGLVGGAALLAVPKIAAMQTALSTLGVSGKSVIGTIAGVGLALTAATIVIGAFAAAQEQVDNDTAAFQATLNQTTGALTENTRAAVAKKLADSGIYEAAKKAGISQQEYTDAILKGGSALDSVNKKLTEYKTNGSTWDTISSFGTQGFDALASTLKTTRGEIAASTQSIKDQTAATKGGSSATDEAASATVRNNAALATMSSVADSTTESVSDLATAISDFGKGALDVDSAERAFHQSLDDMTAAVAKNGATLDLNTQAGRDNDQALSGIASSTLALASAQATAGGSTATLTGTVTAGRQAFINAAIAAGDTAAAANSLADSYGLIPANVNTAINVTGLTAAQQAIDTFIQKNSGRQVVVKTVTGSVAYSTANANGGLYDYGTPRVTAFADGGGVDSGMYAGRPGGLYKFAEASTGWEAFISGKAGQETRNRQIWVQAGERLGMVGGASQSAPTPVQVVLSQKGGVDILKYVDVQVSQAKTSNRVTVENGIQK